MNSKPLTLSIDCGTQSIRAILFDSSGNTIKSSKVIFEKPYFSVKPGWAEQNPKVWLEGMFNAIKKLSTTFTTEEHHNLISLSITTMRDTFICLDKNYEVVRPSILWLDQRKSGVDSKLPAFSNLLFKLAGMSETVWVNRQSGSCNWIMKNEKENWDKTKHYVSLNSYLMFSLTGNLLDSIGNQCGHIPYDYKRSKWMDEKYYKYCIFPIETDKLIDLVESGSDIGIIKDDVASQLGLKKNIKVIATGTDKGCETLGSGCINSSLASLSFGTTSTVQLTLDKYVEPQQFLPAYPAVIPNYFNSEIEVYRGYWMISWYIEQFASKERTESIKLKCPTEKLLDETLKKIPPGCDGLLLQPYWGPGLKIPEAKGAIIGFSDYHTKHHLYRAIIEGINYALIDGLNTVSKRAHKKVEGITVNGGGAKSDQVCQITADMFGHPVYRAQTTETSALGTAICAMVGSGIYSNYETAVENMVHHSSVFTPNLEINNYYKNIYEEVYYPLYSKLKPLYLNLRNIILEHQKRGII